MFELDPEKTEIVYKKTISRKNVEALISYIKTDCGAIYEDGALKVPEAMENFLNWEPSTPTPSGSTLDDLMTYITDELNRLEEDPDFNMHEYAFYSIVEWLETQFGTNEICINTMCPGDDSENF